LETIKRMTIENFQSHARTEIEFGAGLNVIVGPSDHGKSAIIRALRWVLFNEPRGADFIRTGESECRVTVELSSGATITRLRSSSKNRYVLNTPDGTEQIFEGFGSVVPQEIIDVHGMLQIYLDSDLTEPLNFGYQLDGPFLLAESGATKAKAIGRLSGVHIVDAAIRTLLRDMTAQQQEERRLTAVETNLQERLPEYADLPQLAAAVQRGEELSARLQEKIERCRQLTALAGKWSDLAGEYERTAGTLRRLTAISGAERSLSAARTALTLHASLTAAGAKLAVCGDEQAELAALLSKTERLPEAAALFLQLQAKQMLCSRLQRSADTLATNEAGVLASRDTLARTACLERIETEQRQARQMLVSVARLGDCQRKLEQTQQELTQQRQEHLALSRLAAADECRTQAGGNLMRRQRLAELFAAWQENGKNRTTGEAYLSNLMEQTNRLLAAYQAELRVIGKCPFCFNPIDDPAINRIVEALAKEGKTVNAE